MGIYSSWNYERTERVYYIFLYEPDKVFQLDIEVQIKFIPRVSPRDERVLL